MQGSHLIHHQMPNCIGNLVPSEINTQSAQCQLLEHCTWLYLPLLSCFSHQSGYSIHTLFWRLLNKHQGKITTFFFLFKTTVNKYCILKNFCLCKNIVANYQVEQVFWYYNMLTKLCTCRTPSFVDQLIEAENGLGEVVKSPEKSFWAKYVSNSCKYLRKLFLVPFNLTIASCFSVDVHHSSWSHCHECCHGSSEHAGGASWRAGPTWSSKGTKCCSKEKMISVLPIWFLSRL